jgi:hypothetical protein
LHSTRAVLDALDLLVERLLVWCWAHDKLRFRLLDTRSCACALCAPASASCASAASAVAARFAIAHDDRFGGSVGDASAAATDLDNARERLRAQAACAPGRAGDRWRWATVSTNPQLRALADVGARCNS